jgi:uncharacterized protein with PIN domain
VRRRRYRLSDLRSREVREQMMGELGDREDIDEVEEQLHVGDRGRRALAAVTQHGRGYRHPSRAQDGGAGAYDAPAATGTTHPARLAS